MIFTNRGGENPEIGWAIVDIDEIYDVKLIKFKFDDFPEVCDIANLSTLTILKKLCTTLDVPHGPSKNTAAKHIHDALTGAVAKAKGMDKADYIFELRNLGITSAKKGGKMVKVTDRNFKLLELVEMLENAKAEEANAAESENEVQSDSEEVQSEDEEVEDEEEEGAEEEAEAEDGNEVIYLAHL